VSLVLGDEDLGGTVATGTVSPIISHGNLAGSTSRPGRSETAATVDKRKDPGRCVRPNQGIKRENRAMAKPSSRRVAASNPKIKTAVCLSPDTFKRLGAACLAESLSQSELVELLINRACSGYVISIRGQRIGDVHVNTTDRQEPTTEINSAA
jgi:hypothetical protein